MWEVVAAGAGLQGPSNLIAQGLPGLAAYGIEHVEQLFRCLQAKNFPGWDNWPRVSFGQVSEGLPKASIIGAKLVGRPTTEADANGRSSLSH